MDVCMHACMMKYMHGCMDGWMHVFMSYISKGRMLGPDVLPREHARQMEEAHDAMFAMF